MFLFWKHMSFHFHACLSVLGNEIQHITVFCFYKGLAIFWDRKPSSLNNCLTHGFKCYTYSFLSTIRSLVLFFHLSSFTCVYKILTLYAHSHVSRLVRNEESCYKYVLSVMEKAYKFMYHSKYLIDHNDFKNIADF